MARRMKQRCSRGASARSESRCVRSRSPHKEYWVSPCSLREGLLRAQEGVHITDPEQSLPASANQGVNRRGNMQPEPIHEPIRFGGTTLGHHRHACAFFNSPEEEDALLLPFL